MRNQRLRRHQTPPPWRTFQFLEVAQYSARGVSRQLEGQRMSQTVDRLKNLAADLDEANLPQELIHPWLAEIDSARATRPPGSRLAAHPPRGPARRARRRPCLDAWSWAIPSASSPATMKRQSSSGDEARIAQDRAAGDGAASTSRGTIGVRCAGNYWACGSLEPINAEYPGRDSNPHDREAGGF